jgi:hypothetical protein
MPVCYTENAQIPISFYCLFCNLNYSRLMKRLVENGRNHNYTGTVLPTKGEKVVNFKRGVGYLVVLHEKGLQILRQGLPGGAWPALVARHAGQILPTGIDINLTKTRI